MIMQGTLMTHAIQATLLTLKLSYVAYINSYFTRAIPEMFDCKDHIALSLLEHMTL